MKTCFGWPEASPNTFIASGNIALRIQKDWLISDHGPLTTGPFVADDTIFKFIRSLEIKLLILSIL